MDTPAGGRGRPRASVTTGERVREVLSGSGFRRFFTARSVSQFGDGLFQIAAADVLLFDDPGANPALKLLTISAVVLIPFSVVGPFVGVFIDRWERHKILTRVPLLRALVAATMPLAALVGTDSPVFYAVVLFVLSANRFFLATMSAVLPQLVPEDDLLVANSVSSTGGSVANVVGLASGTALAGLVGGTRAAVFAAVAFALGALAARRVPVHRGLEPRRAPLGEEFREVVAQMAEGLRVVRRDRRVRFAMSSIVVVQVLVGALSAALTYAYLVTLDLEVGAATGLLAFLAVGIGIGIVFVPLVARRVRHDRLVPVAFVIAAAGVFFASAFEVARTPYTIATFVAGISYAFAKIPVDTIVQEQMADQIRGRAFAVYDMLFNLARVTGIALMAFAYEGDAQTRALVARLGIVYLAAAAVFWLWEHRLERRPERSPLDLLEPGELVTVRAYAGHRADEEPRAIVVAGHEIDIEGIEWRAVVEEDGRRARVFVCRVGDRRVRLALDEDDGWRIERVTRGPS